MTPAGEITPEQPISSPEPNDKKRVAALNLLEKVADETTRTHIITAEIERELFEQDWRLARVFQMSGQFKDLKTLTESQAIATAMAKIRLGRGWNLNETEAMQFVVFINGVPTLQNEIIASRLMDAGYHWDLTFEEKKDGEGSITTGCVFLPKFRKTPTSAYEPMLDGEGKRIRIYFGHYEASHTNIYEGGKTIKLSEKWNYVAYPRSMYYWRCIAMFRRQHATNILSGARMPSEAEEVSLDQVVTETDRRRETSAEGVIEDRIAKAKRENAERLVKKLYDSGQIDQAKQSAKANGVAWASYEEAIARDTAAASGGPTTAQAAAEAIQTPETEEERRLSARDRDLRVYLGKLGEEFGKILATHGIGSLREAAEASDDTFIALVKDFEDAGKPKVETEPQVRRNSKQQDDFKLRA